MEAMNVANQKAEILGRVSGPIAEKVPPDFKDKNGKNGHITYAFRKTIVCEVSILLFV